VRACRSNRNSPVRPAARTTIRGYLDRLDVQMADLERNIGAAVAIEAETDEPVTQRLAEAVARFGGVFVLQRPKVSARRFVQEIQFRRRLRAIQAPKRPVSS
jgi:predicted SpoU family rRNA methylase